MNEVRVEVTEKAKRVFISVGESGEEGPEETCRGKGGGAAWDVSIPMQWGVESILMFG